MVSSLPSMSIRDGFDEDVVGAIEGAEADTGARGTSGTGATDEGTGGAALDEEADAVKVVGTGAANPGIKVCTDSGLDVVEAPGCTS